MFKFARVNNVVFTVIICNIVVLTSAFADDNANNSIKNRKLDNNINEFMKNDANHDGLVSLEEVRAMIKKQNPASPDFMINLLADKVMNSFDADKNGFISKVEAAIALSKEMNNLSCTKCK
ncbi:hypothetical protein [Pseudaquidulcibacter saccharophilus]|uniref:hypothetical protein n=1 Tax=Pseudaquidulcibacter saccharophilus TaxID=2831900 RepID=UPI001EFF201B|nr:hypothetical protein [Pseudaquidulcibacter saccharophilus]